MEYLKKSMLNLTMNSKSKITKTQSQEQSIVQTNCMNCNSKQRCHNKLNLKNCCVPSINKEINDKTTNYFNTSKSSCNLMRHFSNLNAASSTKECHAITGLRKSQSTPAFIIGEDVDSRMQQSNHAYDNNNNNNNNAVGGQQQCKIDTNLRYGCAHYKRRAMFVTPCCKKFYKCRFCHDENESHHFDRKTLTELICSECKMRQKVQEQCEYCGIRFGKYICLVCNLFDDTDKQQYHCNECGICRIGGTENFFHCKRCDMCLPIQLKINGHRCVENISRSNCPVCLGDIHTSRIPCHIPDCGHLLHKMCFDQLLKSGYYTCPTCQTSLIDMSTLWDFLDAQALLTPMPKHYESQTINIFCNDCHKTSKTKFHFIGLKCKYCGAYNTTQDVKRRISLDEPNSA